MKKAFLTLISLCSIAIADTTVITFNSANNATLKTEHPFITDALSVHNVKNPTYTLSNGDTLSLATGSSITYASATNGTVEGQWANTAAITQINSDLGLTGGFTAADLSTGSGFYYTATGGANSKSTLTLTLNSAKVGDSITLYVTTASRDSHIKGFSITGITADSITLSYAGLNGNGFNTVSGNSVTYKSSLNNNWSTGTESVMIFKITGTLESTTLVMAQGATAKNGWQTLSYSVIPEPTTATLSLLALAGLAARRRRR